MNTTPETENTDTAVPETAAPAVEKVEKPPKDIKNGVSRPRAGTKTGAVWDIADAISAAKQRPALREEVLEQGRAQELTDGTIATQYARWTRYHGVTKEQRSAARDAMKPAPAPEDAGGEAETETAGAPAE